MERSETANSLKERIKKHIPFWLQKHLYRGVKRARHLVNTIKNEKFTKQYFADIFKKAGIKKDDIVLVHSSMSRIGLLERGPDDIIDALIEILGIGGLLIMPGFSDLKFDKTKNAYVFDIEKSPTYTGKIPETFRKKKGVARSISPTHSLCALGEKSMEFVKGHEFCDNPFSMTGPFGKLYKWNAKVILIGVDQLANTILHIVEDFKDFPVEVFTPKFRCLISGKGPDFFIEARRHRDYLRQIRDPNMMEKYCKEYGVMKIYKIGNTQMRIINVRDFVEMMKKLYKKGITIYPVKQSS